MSEFFASHQDLRKLATVFRRPDVALTDCRSDSGRLVLCIRADVAQFVDIVRKFKDSLQVEATATLELQLLDTKRIGIQLVDLKIDAKAIPKVLGKLAMPMIRRSLFDQIPPTNGVTVEKDKERVIADVGQILRDRGVPAACDIKRVMVEHDGLRVFFMVDAKGGMC